jgi:hypothetical protein
MTATAKGGNIRLKNIRAVDAVEPDQPCDVEVDATNGATFIPFWDNDSCDNGSNSCKVDSIGVEGYCVVVDFYVDGNRVATEGPDCLNAAALGAPTGTKKTTVSIDTEGTYTLGARVRLPGSGETTETVTRNLVVSSEESEEAPRNGNGNGGNGDEKDGSILDSITNKPVASAVAIVSVGAAISVATIGE